MGELIIDAYIDHFWDPNEETVDITRFNERLLALKPGDDVRLIVYSSIIDDASCASVDLLFNDGERTSINVEDDKDDLLLAKAGDGGTINATMGLTSMSEWPGVFGTSMTRREYRFRIAVHV